MSAVTLFRGKLRERQIRERITAERAFGYCSEGEIRQALVNLIGNAVDAMREAGSLRIHVMPVSLNGVEYARLTVADTGGGNSKRDSARAVPAVLYDEGQQRNGAGAVADARHRAEERRKAAIPIADGDAERNGVCDLSAFDAAGGSAAG